VAESQRAQLLVQPFDSACSPVGFPLYVPRTGATITLPGRTVYIGVWVSDAFAQLTWSIA
jgi:hypothetical protein